MGGTGIALLILNLDARRGWVVSTTPRPPYPRERPSTHCTKGWVGPTAGLDVCEKSRPQRDSIPGPSIPQPVAIPTELPGPLIQYVSFVYSVTIPVRVSGLLITYHQEVTMYICYNWY